MDNCWKVSGTSSSLSLRYDCDCSSATMQSSSGVHPTISSLLNSSSSSLRLAFPKDIILSTSSTQHAVTC